MPTLLVAAMLIVAVIAGWIGVVRLTRSVRQTSLTAAATWAFVCQTTLTITATATLVQGRVPPGILDQLWYLTAVTALCPFVAVLGARRSRLLEWSLFIVLPLIVVLEWPALAQWMRCWQGQRLELEAPALIGFGLVMVMSTGNFAGDPHGISGSLLWWIGTWILVVVGLARGVDWNGVTGEFFPHSLATIIFQITVWQYGTRSSERSRQYAHWDRVWLEFQCRFGIVWTLRLMARFNEVAQREQWPWRLMPNGLQPSSREQPHPGDAIYDPRVDHTLRWLLKPFVDPEWIDVRLRLEKKSE